MTKVFITTILLAAAMCAASCNKGPLVCYCTSNDGTRSDQQYGLTTDDDSQAQTECNNYEENLGNGGGDFDCFVRRHR